MSHSSAPDVAAKLQDARSRGGRTTGARRAAERAKRNQERYELCSESAISVYLGIAARLSVATRDSSHAMAASRIAEQAMAALNLRADLNAWQRWATELEGWIVEYHPDMAPKLKAGRP